MQVWYEEGAINHHFNPAMNYSGPENKFINNNAPEKFDAKGNAYYLSYPPFTYIFPYVIFKSLHITPNILGIRIINLLLQLLGATFLFKIILLFAKISPLSFGKGKRVRQSGFIAVIFFIFNPAGLFFQQNLWMTDVAVIPLFIITAWWWLKLITEKKLSSFKHLAALFLLVFFFNYTEYLGFTFSVVLGLFCFVRSFKDKKFLFPLCVLVVATLLAFVVTFLQYSSIWNIHEFWQIAKDRYSYRSGYETGNENGTLQFFSNWKIVFQNYVLCFLPQLVFLFLATIILVAKKQTSVFKLHGIKAAIMLFLFPCLLHHFIFLNASLYDFLVLKSIVFISVSAAFLFFEIEIHLKRLSHCLFIAVFISSIIIFHCINKPGEVSRIGDRYDMFETMGEKIKTIATNDEVIFIKNILDEPQLIYYAHRNMRVIENETQAFDFLKKYRRTKGIIFEADEHGTLSGKHIETALP